MVRSDEDKLNNLFNVLQDWEQQLKDVDLVALNEIDLQGPEL